MAHKRITMQDLADACGLSRNTVSKVFNDRGAVPEATKKMVLQKAQEIGYLQTPYFPAPEGEAAPSPARPQNIALITSHMPKDYHFAMLILPVFTERLGRGGYTLMIYELSPEELRERRLPSHMPLEQTAGILGLELFDRGYMDMLCSLGLPVLSVDGCMEAMTTPMNCDFILMENLSSTIALTGRMISAGARRLGFVGDISHCCSFHERWMGFSVALENAGIPLDKSCCILEKDAEPYDDVDWVLEQLRKMPVLPDAFICANDYLAFPVVAALKRLGLAIPGDVMVAGFDDTPPSAVMDPSLTTVQIPSADFGRIAAELLLDRIQRPGVPFLSTYVKTTPVWRGSTGREN